jgi:DNA-binding transcriptional ArsR family regulator
MSFRNTTYIRLAELFSALGDPTRLRIISTLLAGEMSVGEIVVKLDMTESAVSHQLHELRRMRIVRNRKNGRQVYYTLDDNHVVKLYHMGLDHVQHR